SPYSAASPSARTPGPAGRPARDRAPPDSSTCASHQAGSKDNPIPLWSSACPAIVWLSALSAEPDHPSFYCRLWTTTFLAPVLLRRLRPYRREALRCPTECRTAPPWFLHPRPPLAKLPARRARRVARARTAVIAAHRRGSKGRSRRG